MRLLSIFVFSLCLSACANKGGTSDVNNQGTGGLSCGNSVAATAGENVFLEDVFDAKPGTYRLVEVNQYIEMSEIKTGGKASMQTRTRLSPQTDANQPTSIHEVICSDLSQIPNGKLSVAYQTPFVISRTDGSIQKDLKIEIVLYGSKLEDKPIYEVSSGYPDRSHFPKARDGANSKVTRLNATSVEIYDSTKNAITSWDSDSNKYIETGALSLTTRSVYQLVE